MKKLFLTLILFFSLVSLTFAGTSNVTFEWNANNEPDLAGYKLYQSTTSGIYIFGLSNEVLNIPAGTATGTINVIDGIWFWVLTAYDTEGNESGPSNEVTMTLDATGPDAPSGLTITIIIKVQ